MSNLLYKCALTKTLKKTLIRIHISATDKCIQIFSAIKSIIHFLFFRNIMPPAMRPRVIQVDRSSRGFGLSLIYRGLDKFEEKDTGIFVARVVPGGQSARFGVKENDKIISINNKNPRNVDDAVGIIKDAGKSIKLMLLRQEEVPDVVVDDNLSLASGEMDSNWVSCILQFVFSIILLRLVGHG